MCLYNSPLSIYFADVWSTFSPICATRYYSPTNRGLLLDILTITIQLC